MRHEIVCWCCVIWCAHAGGCAVDQKDEDEGEAVFIEVKYAFDAKPITSCRTPDEVKMLAQLRAETAPGRLEEPERYVAALSFARDQTVFGGHVTGVNYLATGVTVDIRGSGGGWQANLSSTVYRTRREAVDALFRDYLDHEVAVVQRRFSVPGLPPGSIVVGVESAMTMCVRNVVCNVCADNPDACLALVFAVAQHIEEECRTAGVKVVPYPDITVSVELKRTEVGRVANVALKVPKGLEYVGRAVLYGETIPGDCRDIVNGVCTIPAEDAGRTRVEVQLATPKGYVVRVERACNADGSPVVRP